MTIKETTKFMERIKQHYQDFIIDDMKIEEWHHELKDYSLDDVNKKLDEHLKSEQYGNYIPKVYFLTKYLKKEKEKNVKDKFLVKCPFCGEYVKDEIYMKHYERCSSVDYIIRKRKELFNEETPEELKAKYKSLSEDTFDMKYFEFLNKIYNYVSEDEKARLEKIILTFKDRK